jgi:hypothetical protein
LMVNAGELLGRQNELLPRHDRGTTQAVQLDQPVDERPEVGAG